MVGTGECPYEVMFRIETVKKSIYDRISVDVFTI